MDIQKINKDRLESWRKRCNELESTPQILITLNPETAKLGLITTHDIETPQIKALLMYALKNL